jgi:dTDP-4-dehydrorhamnose 3,5-epimerase
MSDITVETTPIPGMLVIHLPVHGDARGWFKENWQRLKMTELGLPDFGPVQNNVSFNAEPGTTRGIHAEPWDKLVSVGTGRVFAAWVDLREGPSFGTQFHAEIGIDTTVFIPRGAGNSYQALEPDTIYNYLVNAHWSPGITYPAVNLDDPALAIPWPIPLEEAEMSAKDRINPLLVDVVPMSPRKTLITGADGQLGRALQRVFPDAVPLNKAHLDITDRTAVDGWPWVEYDTIVNTAAFTMVDQAETEEGRRRAWQVNALGAANLARASREHGLTLIHFSTDYDFDGTVEVHDETEPMSPLGSTQTKAAGDVAVATCRGTTWSAPAGSSARARTSSGRCAPWPSAGSARRSSATRSAGSPSPARSPGRWRTCWGPTRSSGPTTSPTPATRPAGPTSPPRCSGCPGAIPRTSHG